MFSSRTLRFANPLFRQGVLRFALLLALFAALAPTVSRTVNGSRTSANQLIEICSTSGPRWMAFGSPINDGSQSTPDSVPVFDHCPFCLLTHEQSAPPPQVLVFDFALLVPAAVLGIAPINFLVTHHPPLPPARGPPSFF